jgi:hypothetical protein
VPPRYLVALQARLETETAIAAVVRLDAVYLGPSQVLVAADVTLSEGLSGGDVAAALERVRDELKRERPVIARVYLTPVSAGSGER